MKIHSIVKHFSVFMMWTSVMPYVTDLVIALFSVMVLTKE